MIADVAILIRLIRGSTTRKAASNAMNAIRVTALALIAVGVLALAYGGLSYTRETGRA